MNTLFTILLLVGIIYAGFKFVKYTKFKQIERDVRTAHQDGWKLIEQANESLERPIDMSVLKIINPELYSEVKLRERMRKDRINPKFKNNKILNKVITTSLLVALVVLAGCSETNNNMLCTYNDDPLMESQVKEYYVKLAEQDIKDKYNARCTEKLEKDTKQRSNIVSGAINHIESIVATGGTTGF